MGEAQRMQEHYANQRRRHETFEVGDQVLLATDHVRTEADRMQPSRKLAAKYSGPYPIKEKLSDVVYVLDLPESMKVHPVFHISRLKRFHERAAEMRGEEDQQLPPPPIIIDGQEEYEVERIIAKRRFQDQVQYLVKWAGYPIEEAMWLTKEDMKNASDLIKEFEERTRNASRTTLIRWGTNVTSTHNNGPTVTPPTPRAHE
jgi:hypothetical protein